MNKMKAIRLGLIVNLISRRFDRRSGHFQANERSKKKVKISQKKLRNRFKIKFIMHDEQAEFKFICAYNIIIFKRM
jgi:hypothetical protein